LPAGEIAAFRNFEKSLAGPVPAEISAENSIPLPSS
jgi:hypothetical protein